MSQSKQTSPTLLRGAMALGALGVLGSYVTAGHERFWANWVFWFVLMFTLGLGALFIVALEHLVNAKWSVPVRRIPERVATLLLPAIPVGLIALCALPVLYPGTRPEAAHNPILAGKAFWLGVPFFSVRTLASAPSACGCSWEVRSGRTPPGIRPSTSGPASSPRLSWPPSPW